MIFSYISYY